MAHSFVVSSTPRPMNVFCPSRGGWNQFEPVRSSGRHFKAPRFNRPEPVRAGLDGGGFDKVK